jgi:hypothetical protein
VVAASDQANGYRYEFTDESLLGDGHPANSTIIVGSRRIPRTLLIRPRTQFVTEMLKSVEAL